MEKGESRESYRVVLEGGQGELVEKKSRFTASVRPAQSEEEAAAFVEEIKKKYWDASHNCSAFVIGKRAELTRCSDDGEPSGTAGRPMLEVLLGEGIRNAVVVVTRYFGGTLLGTGGLVRAYGGAVKAGLAASRLGMMRYGVRLLIDTDYSGSGRILHLLGQKGIKPENIDYTDRVRIGLVAPLEAEASLIKDITEATGGRAVLMEVENLYFIDKDSGVQYS